MNLPVLKLIFEILDKTAAPMRGLQGRLAMLSRQSRLALTGTGQTVQRMGQVLLAATAGVTAAAEIQRGATMDSLNALESLGVKKLNLLHQAALDFSNVWSGANRTEFLESAYKIRSGLSHLTDEATANLTEVSALTAKATRATTLAMAQTFVKGHNLFRQYYKSDREYAEAFGAGLTAAVQKLNTDGEKMSTAFSSLGNSATVFGVTMKEQIGMLGLAMSMGNMEPGQAGTGFRAFVEKLGFATEKTGQRFIDTSGKAKSMVEIFKLLRVAYANAEKAGDVNKFWLGVKEAFGSEEAVQFIEKFISKIDLMEETFGDIEKSAKRGLGYIKPVAEIFNKGEGSGWKKILQTLSNLADVIGKALSPVVIPLMKQFHGVAVRVQKWVEANPKLTRTIIIIAGALGVAAVAIGTFTAAMAGLSIVAWTNPVTWIAAGITAAVLAIIAAGVLLYNYWDDISAWWSGLWDEWGGVITAALPMIVIPIRMLGALKDWLVNNWDELGPWFKNLWDGIVQSVVGPVKWIWTIIRWMLKKVKETITEAFSWLPESAQNWVKGKLGMKVETTAPAASQASQASKAAQDSYTRQAIEAYRANQALAARGGAQQGFEGKLSVEIKPPRGWSATVTQYDQSGDANFDVFAGLVPTT